VTWIVFNAEFCALLNAIQISFNFGFSCLEWGRAAIMGIQAGSVQFKMSSIWLTCEFISNVCTNLLLELTATVFSLTASGLEGYRSPTPGSTFGLKA